LFYHQGSAAAPQDSSIRHPFLTPVRAPPIKEVGFTILRNASDRVTEILRENRRRLDAGEDPNTIRSMLDLKSLPFDLISLISFFPPLPFVLEAARRKRALELSAIRKGRAKFISLA
jgi:hypothetical protein